MSASNLQIDDQVYKGITKQAKQCGFANARSFLISIAKKMKNFRAGCLPPDDSVSS